MVAGLAAIFFALFLEHWDQGCRGLALEARSRVLWMLRGVPLKYSLREAKCPRRTY